ncbi:MAG: hypothetical protein JJ939_02890 [Alphaproteobacteria bacterium]|nr:hypothetical protein [Alphaproteobacteria bacterium]MBO6627348.1 hypothetical protein [Alphaproteobacteria bacterium]MDF1626920.1 hypothetical protein [Parvibaculaceae bacterium]
MFKSWREGAVHWSSFDTPWSEADGEAYLAALRALKDVTTPFVIATVIENDIGAMAAEQRREQALIFKSIKSHLQSLCLGMVRVRAQGSQADDATMSKGFGWPVVSVMTREEGRACAAAMLKASA